MTSADPDLVRRIENTEWFHTIQLDENLVTRGNPPSKAIDDHFPDVRGKSVLDIGAWDGKYSFQAEAEGASRVVALDHYVWRLDGPARDRYYKECEANGVLPDPDMIDRGFLLTDRTPGKHRFDMAHEYLDSKVEAVVDDFMTMDLDSLGTFDVVLYFGVLYHMVDPIGSLRRLKQVTGSLAVIETAGIRFPGAPSEPSLVHFFSGDGLHLDYGNWYAPTGEALVGMCRAAGFRRAEVRAAAKNTGDPITDEAWNGAPRPLTMRQRVAGRIMPSALPVAPINCRLVVYAWT